MSIKREILKSIDRFCKEHELKTDKDKPRYSAYTFSSKVFGGRYINLQVGILDVNKPSKYAAQSKTTMVKNNLVELKSQIAESEFLLQMFKDAKKSAIKTMGNEYYINKVQVLEKQLSDFKVKKQEYKSYREVLEAELLIAKRFRREIARKYDFMQREMIDQKEDEPNPAQQWYRTLGLNKILVISLQVV